MKRHALFALSLCLSLMLTAEPGRARTVPPIHFTATALPSPVRPGEVATVTVRATVDAGWHVYSVVPTPDGPAATDITALGGWAPAGPATEDAPLRTWDPNFGAVVGYHERAATFSRPFRVPTDAAPGPASLRVSVHYQTCNDKICLPPTDASVSVPIAIAAGPARPQYAPPVAPARSAETGGGLGLFLLAALGAGLLALLTPCVFPLIPITLTSFVKQAEGDRAKLVRLSAGYAAGIVALYVALGGAVTLTLGAAGVNRVAASPWVNLALFALFVVFALSFFEAVQLQLPGNLSALQSKARARGGTAGLLLLGVTFVLASFTCTAPFLGTLLVAAAGGARLRPLLGMLTFALAFVSPFLIFSLFPQWIGRIPKGGVWMARFKATLGFLELAAALKFLSNADQVWQWGLLTQPVLLAAWAMIALCAALYLLGPLRFGVVAEMPEPAGTRLPPLRAACGGLFLAAALYCFWGLAGRPLSPYVGAFLPPAGYGGAGRAADAGLPWLSDYGTALAQARTQGKPLLIDFTGYTCTNCRLNEKNVFPRPAVQAALADYVRVQLYTDGGRDGAKNQALQESKFGDVALPLYGVVDPRTGSVVDKTAGVQTVAGFAQFLAHAQPALAAPRPSDAAPSASWSPLSAAALAQAQSAGRPAVVDFTAAWCVNCKAIEHDVFQDPPVAAALGRDFVTLRADLTQWGSPASAAQERQYGIASLPTIIFLDRSGHEQRSLRITGRLSVAEFQRRMRLASPPAPKTT